VLAVKHGEVPTNLHLTKPNPVVTLDGPVRPVQGRQELLSSPDAPRRAGISAFGWSGTNAHVIIEQAPAAEEQEPAPGHDWQLLTLSAGGEAGLRALAARLADHLESTPDAPLADVAHTVRTGRSALPLRRSLVVRDAADAIAQLRADDGERAHTPGAKQSVGLVLTGDTDPASVAGLADTEPAFRAALDECGTPSVFATEYALGSLLAAAGVQINAVFGTGVGAVAAECVAGVRSVADGLRAAAEVERGEKPAPAVVTGVPRIPVVATLADLQSRVDVTVTLGAAEGAKQVSLRAEELGRAEWLTALGRLWELGAPVSWAGPGRLVDLPTYPFQRTTFWPKDAVAGLTRTAETMTEVDVPQPRQSYARPDLRTPYLPPRTPTERTIARVWQDGLGIDAIGVHDPFFELGGTSVVGLAVVSRLAKDFGVELTAATLFERPTIAQFAELLDAQNGAQATTAASSTVDEQAARGARRRAMAQARNRK
jgi:polyketide synthase 12